MSPDPSPEPPAPAPCPICAKPADPAGADFPFCSRRCREVDLGRWFGERYRTSRPIDPEDVED